MAHFLKRKENDRHLKGKDLKPEVPNILGLDLKVTSESVDDLDLNTGCDLENASIKTEI